MGIFDKVGDFIDQIQTTEQYTKETLKNDGGKGSKNAKNPRYSVAEQKQGERARIEKKLNDSFIAMSKEVRRKKGKGGR